MHPNDLLASHQTTSRRASWKILTAIAVSAFFSMTSAAQALYVGFDASPSGDANPIIDMRIGDRSISILTGKTHVTIDNAATGLHLSFELDYKTIRFNDGPVELNRIDWKYPGGKVFARGENGTTAIDQNSSLRQMVTSVTSIGPRLGLSAHGIDFNIVAPLIQATVVPLPPTATNPVPEPGAALLFSAGLVAVGAHSRRRR